MNRLKELRKDKTQEYIANQLGIPRGTYRNYEAGTREPDQETLSKIADYFNVSVDYLLKRTDKPTSATYTIPTNLRDVPIAFTDGLKDLSQEDLNAVEQFVEFLKNKNKQ